MTNDEPLQKLFHFRRVRPFHGQGNPSVAIHHEKRIAKAQNEAVVARLREKQALEAKLLSYAAEMSLAHRDWQEAQIMPMVIRLDRLAPQEAEDWGE